MNRQPSTRDFHKRPRQAGGRTQADYGHTAIQATGSTRDGLACALLAAASVLALLLLGGFAQATI